LATLVAEAIAQIPREIDRRNSLSQQVDAQLIWHLIEQAQPAARAAP
jgi:hypothetical protein